MKFVRLFIPIATLAALFLAWVAARFSTRPDMGLAIAAEPPPSLPPLELPPHDKELRGVVFDARGEPVADALVFARAGDEPFWTYTDASGAFLMTKLPQGPWPICVVARGYTPHKTELSGCSEPCRVDIGAPVPPMKKLAAVGRTPCEGRVTPASGATYEVVLVPVLAPESLDAPVPRRISTDAAGRFAIADLAHGDYRVHVLPSWAESGTWPDLLRPLEGGEARAYAHSENAQGVPLVLELATGSVTADLASSTGTSLEGALVLVTPALDTTRVWPPVTTSADGKLRVSDLPVGTYRISVRAGSASAISMVQVTAGRESRALFTPLDVGRR